MLSNTGDHRKSDEYRTSVLFDMDRMAEPSLGRFQIAVEICFISCLFRSLKAGYILMQRTGRLMQNSVVRFR